MEQGASGPSGLEAGGAVPRRRILLALLAILALAGVALAQFAGARRDPVREGVAPVD